MKKILLFLKSMNRNLSSGQKIFLLSVLTILIMIVVNSVDKENTGDVVSWKSNKDNSMAYVMATEFIKDRLKAPSTAEFQRSTRKVNYQGNQIYFVHVEVDAQNTFGAMLRKTFSVEVEQIGPEKWRCNEIVEY